MDFIRTTAMVMVSGAAIAGLSAQAGAAGLDPSTADTPDIGSTGTAAAPQWAYCGNGWDGGLAVGTEDKSDCPMALRVAKAYHETSHQPPVMLRVDGSAWKCVEREGSPDPYIECVSASGPDATVQLYS
ncbi:hypothetical protein [Streptomyces sp. SP18CS02]|uniref:hypothetical protein n=1 Tax=Streptomyces sp. SP18CS02 TaxID=3002531 RepID=UPI002E75FDC8|nr:hypothetical protein [Streptomyces sp. SP18CS02]MEE1751405.1 hypothetical protein [Streptomyces sp. SP18CS02]